MKLRHEGKKMISESLKISPCYTIKDWKVLDFSTEEEWQKATIEHTEVAFILHVLTVFIRDVFGYTD